MRISKHFKREEFECKCGCGFNSVDVVLLTVLEKIRNYFNEPVVITSGNRCIKYNAYIGGVNDSQHPKGMAVDFKVLNTFQDDVADFLERNYPYTFGIGRYDGRTHLDVREIKARWDKR